MPLTSTVPNGESNAVHGVKLIISYLIWPRDQVTIRKKQQANAGGPFGIYKQSRLGITVAATSLSNDASQQNSDQLEALLKICTIADLPPDAHGPDTVLVDCELSLLL